MLTFNEAKECIRTRLKPLTETESVAIEQACGRVLAQDITAPLSVPAFRNAAMDGYAFAAETGQAFYQSGLRIVGASLAGKPYTGAVAAGECIRIMTGAPLSEHTDTVVMQENVKRKGDVIQVEQEIKPGEHVRHPGEDIEAGATVLKVGYRLNAAAIGVLASVGITTVTVLRPLRIALFTSGDELKEPGETLKPGEIYNSSRYTLTALLQHPGIDLRYLGNLPDHADEVRRRLQNAAKTHDVIISSGGVSVGDADHIGNILDELGMLCFNKVAIKPGKPLTFGQIEAACFFGLPGNPVSSLITAMIAVLPALKRLGGADWQEPVAFPAALSHPLKKKPGRQEFMRGRYTREENGKLAVQSAGGQESHRLSVVSQSNCLMVIPAESGNLDSGQTVDILPFGVFHE